MARRRPRVRDVLRRNYCERTYRDEEGFTLIELTVAMMVTLIVMSSLIALLVGSLRTVALSKQRQAAAALATGVMEQLRALDYGTLSSGLACSDLTGDANITGSCPGTVTFTSPTGGITETVKTQTSTPAAAIAPLYPHKTTRAVENVTYTIATYVTTTAASAEQSYNLTVLVSWTSSVARSGKTIIQRSTEFSPSRCLSSATHPYSGACQASFSGQAGLSNASIVLTESSSGTVPVPGFDLKSLELGLPGLSTAVGVEQVTKLSDAVVTSAGTSTSGGGSATTTGGLSGAAAADTDPSTTSSGSQTASVTQSGTTTLTVDGTPGRLRVTPLSTDSGSVTAQTAATAGSCLDSAGVALNVTGRPCSNGNVTPAGTNGRLSYNPTGSLRTFDVASVAAAPTTTRAVVARVTGAGGTACPTASGVGCITAQASRSLGQVKLGALPAKIDVADVVPTGWTGSFIQLDGVVENAYADSGVGARSTPAYRRTAGTLTYYDPAISATRIVNLTTLTADQVINPAAVTAQYHDGLNTIDVRIDPAFTIGAPVASAPATSGSDPLCKAQACAAKATASSVVRATFEYTFNLNGIQLTHFYVIADLGSVLAQTSYKAAFDA